MKELILKGFLRVLSVQENENAQAEAEVDTGFLGKYMWSRKNEKIKGKHIEIKDVSGTYGHLVDYFP